METGAGANGKEKSWQDSEVGPSSREKLTRGDLCFQNFQTPSTEQVRQEVPLPTSGSSSPVFLEANA